MENLENKDIFEISEILLKDTKHILKDVSGYSLEELLDEIQKTDNNTLESIYSSEKLIKDSTLVKKGIYPYRALLSEKAVEYRRKKLNLQNNPYFKEWDENGIIVIEDFLPTQDFLNIQSQLNNEKKSGYNLDLSLHPDFSKIVQMCLATSELTDNDGKKYLNLLGTDQVKASSYTLGSEYVIHAPNDDQVNVHSDIFHPNLKIWLYINDCNIDNGPYSFVYKSHKKTPKMLEFIHKQGLIWDKGADHPDFFKYNSAESTDGMGSPRILRSENCTNDNMDEVNKELEKLDLPPVTTLKAKANTIIFTDTTGFHARGYAKPGSERYSLRNAFRTNPFIV
tara:strand:- start:166 stop:1179 length:1014 start_codon:yes stop_codon:yes gene_type:complete